VGKKKSAVSGQWSKVIREEYEEEAISTIHNLRSTIFSAVKISLEDSALRGRIALPVKETRFQECNGSFSDPK
jgi:hypothetical protein